MNIVFDINQISLQNIYILEQKKNIIMDGQFTKLIYSNEWFSMNGIYLQFPIDNFSVENILNKKTIRFNPYSINQILIQKLSSLELQILELYKKNTFCCKKINNILAKQIYSGSMKITREYLFDNNQREDDIKTTYDKMIIKISGVWENNDEIGLTYKLIE